MLDSLFRDFSSFVSFRSEPKSSAYRIIQQSWSTIVDTLNQRLHGALIGLPAHNCLQDQMKPVEGSVAGNQKSPPYGWTDVQECYLHLIHQSWLLPCHLCFPFIASDRWSILTPDCWCSTPGYGITMSSLYYGCFGIILSSRIYAHILSFYKGTIPECCRYKEVSSLRVLHIDKCTNARYHFVGIKNDKTIH